MANKFKNAVTQQIADFIESIGLEIESVNIPGNTFLPGILVKGGRILVDEATLEYPGDILHEAGHLALASRNVRASLSGEVELPDVLMEQVESSAMLWSYAAILFLGLDPRIVFHAGGYRGSSESLLFNFSLGVFLGLSVLEDAGMSVTGDNARKFAIPPYPHMIKWLKD